MSDESREHSAALHLSTSSASEPTAPPWLTQAIVLLQTWWSGWLLLPLVERVRLVRGRAGDFEVMDFVLLLVAYASSGARTLKVFYEQGQPVAQVIMGAWGRNRMPCRSALSRFLSAVTMQVVEALREVFFDLLVHGARGHHLGGLSDRQGKRWLLFDLDGTRKAYRQRAVAQGTDRPAPRRRAAKLAAAGYTGRKRGEVVRGRLTVQQAHTSEWLGTYGEAGNGMRWPRLEKAADAIAQYLRAHGVEPGAGLLRFDGEYGWAHTVLVLAARSLGHLMRCVDYRLLELPLVQQALLQPPQRFEQVDTGTVREVFDAGLVSWRSEVDEGATVTTRLVVARTRVTGSEEPKVGKRRGEWGYELFVTSCGPEALSATDVLSLYFARGGFEQTLRQEDEELELDRWASGNPHGQELWQVLGQWVWNQRLQLGLVATPSAPRCTLWSEALPVGPIATATSSSDEVQPTGDAAAIMPPSIALTDASAPSVEHVSDPAMAKPSVSASDADVHAPSVERVQRGSETSLSDGAPPASTAGSAPAPSLERTDAAPSTLTTDATSALPKAVMLAKVEPMPQAARDGFVLQADGTVLCPEQKLLRRVEIRGDRLRFMARAADCRACLKAVQCMRPGVSGDNGRRLDWPIAGAEPTRARLTVSRTEAKRTPAAVFTPPPPPGPHPLYWYDLPATQLRRRLPASLSQQRIDGLPSTTAPSTERRVFTRDQRAHRRLRWDARLARNARSPSARALRLHFHGVPATLAAYLGLQGDG